MISQYYPAKVKEEEVSTIVENALDARELFPGLIQSAWIYQHLFHGQKPDRKYLRWSAAGVAIFAPATVGPFFTLFVKVKTHVWSNDGAWQKKNSTEENPHTAFPFTPDVLDKTNPANRKFILSLSLFSLARMLRDARFRVTSVMLMKMPEVQFCWVTWSKQPPAVVLVRGTLAVMAVARCLVVAGFAIHLKAVFGTLLRGTSAVFSQVTLAC